jgi:hypothetical protein
MKVTVHYIQGESDIFTNLSAVIWKRRNKLTLIRNEGEQATEINIPADNIRWWKVER